MSLITSPRLLTSYNRSELEDIFLDNTHGIDDYQNLGILRFAKMCFPERFHSPFAPLHHQMAMLFFELLSPKRLRSHERQGAYLVHREAAKSTTGTFLFAMYLIYLKGRRPVVRQYKKGNSGEYDVIALPPIDERFIMICSETGSSAEDFVTSIKDTLDEREDLAEIFGEKNPQYMLDAEDERKKKQKWTQRLFRTADDTVVRAVGAGQQVRGRNIGGSRPTFCIVDDMYSEGNTKTSESMSKLRNWFYNSLINSLDSINGKILWLGTMVHPDIVAKDFEDDDDWLLIRRPIISREELEKAKAYCETEDGFKVPSRSFMLEKQKEFKTLSWPDRHDLHYIMKKYEKAMKGARLDGFYREYMNEPQAPESHNVSVDTFQSKEFRTYKKQHKQMIEWRRGNANMKGEIILKIGVDMAATTKHRSDKTVIMVAGLSRCYPYADGEDFRTSIAREPDGMVMPFIVECLHGHYDVHADEKRGRPGLCEDLWMLYNRYNISQVIIEANGQQELAVREVRKYFEARGAYGKIKSEFVNQEKSERINAVLLPLIQLYKHFYCKPGKYIQILYTQMLNMGYSDHDDFPDALEECFKNPAIPNLAQFEWEEKPLERARPAQPDWYYL